MWGHVSTAFSSQECWSNNSAVQWDLSWIIQEDSHQNYLQPLL